MAQSKEEQEERHAERQQELEPINEKLRGETIEEIVADGDERLIISFVGDAPDLELRPTFDLMDAEINLRWLE